MAATAIIGGAVIGGGISAIGANSAANTEAGAANNANNISWDEFQQQQANEKPYLTAGTQALGQLQGEMPQLTRQFTAADFQQDPGYAFDLSQGMQAMQRSAAAKGMLNSMGTMQNLNNYAQGMASNEYQNAYNRFVTNQQQQYNMLSGIAGMGNTANGQLAQVGMNTANNMSANTMGAGNAIAAGQVGMANAIGGSLSNAGNGYMNYAMMSKLFPGSNGTNTGGFSPDSYGGLNGSSSLGQNLGPLAGGSYSPQPTYGLGIPSLTE